MEGSVCRVYGGDGAPVRAAARAVLHAIEALRRRREPLLVAIDGRCASGKTTLAALLAASCDCNVIHMDHFFLRPAQRTAQRLEEPGGNVDYERFLEEALLPLKSGAAFSYRPFDCRRQELEAPLSFAPKPIGVIEGAYCCRPGLFEGYDLTVFMTVDEAAQWRRILRRNGPEAAALYRDRWIPMEERYFSRCRVRERCTLRFSTGEGGV